MFKNEINYFLIMAMNEKMCNFAIEYNSQYNEHDR